jgi:hypothetical protein
MFEADPGTAGNTQPEIEITKGNLYSVHGPIGKNDIIYQSWKKDQKKCPVFPVLAENRFPSPRL